LAAATDAVAAAAYDSSELDLLCCVLLKRDGHR